MLSRDYYIRVFAALDDELNKIASSYNRTKESLFDNIWKCLTASDRNKVFKVVGMQIDLLRECEELYPNEQIIDIKAILKIE